MRKRSSISSSEGRRLLTAAGLLAAPFAAIWAVEMFLLPWDAFTFRVAEAIGVHRLTGLLPGPFYPDAMIDRPDEQGDLAGPTRLALRRRSLWITDRRGHRFDARGAAAPAFEVVLVGDSNIWESVLSQEKLVGRRLASRLDAPVYSYAPETLDRFLADPDFLRNPPRAVVFVRSERVLTETLAPGDGPASFPGRERSTAATRALILVDRALKAALLHRVQADFERALERIYRRRVLGLDGDRLEPLGFSRIGRDGKTLFGVVELAYESPDDAAMKNAANVFSAYQKRFAERGIRLVIFPVPAKSTVHYRLAGRAAPRDGLRRLGAALRAAGVDEIDPLPAFLERAGRGESLYEQDDNHWNAAGADLAAELIARRLKDFRPRARPQSEDGP